VTKVRMEQDKRIVEVRKYRRYRRSVDRENREYGEHRVGMR
jgi:hypothetical protein